MRRLSLVTIILVPIALAMVGNLASSTVRVSAAWWPWAVWSFSGVLVAITVVTEVRRRQIGEHDAPGGVIGLDHATAQAGGVSIGAAPAVPSVADTLPADVPRFIGRQAELEQVVQTASRARVRINAIDGMAGVGKTAFAVHAAHELILHFPDGQLFVRLHGHTPGQQPVEPSDALVTLLLSTGIAADQIPPGLDARASLWRERMAGKKMLIVLDDATGSDQVLPLLPGSAEGLVLITSRRRLTALTQAVSLTLETLDPGEAGRLFTLLAGRPALDQDDAGVTEIARLCGYLPLAITLMAAQLKHHPAWTTDSLAANHVNGLSRARGNRQVRDVPAGTARAVVSPR